MDHLARMAELGLVATCWLPDRRELTDKDCKALNTAERGFIVERAPHAKGKMLVHVTDSRDGLKGRSSYLLDALNAPYHNRQRGYIVSPAALKKLVALYDAGYEARTRIWWRGKQQPAHLYKGDGPDMSLADALRAAGHTYAKRAK